MHLWNGTGRAFFGGGQLSWNNTPTFPRAWDGLPAASAFQFIAWQPLAQQGAEFLLPSPSPPKNPNQILGKFHLLNLPPFSPASRFFGVQVRSSGSSQQGEGRCGLSRGLCGTMEFFFFSFFFFCRERHWSGTG